MAEANEASSVVPILFTSDSSCCPAWSCRSSSTRPPGPRSTPPGPAATARCWSPRGSRTATRPTAWWPRSSRSAGSPAAEPPRPCSRPSGAPGSAPASPGPGAALWVEARARRGAHATEEVTRARRGVQEARRCRTLQRREAWQVIDTVNQLTDPSALADAAGYAPYLTDDRKRELLETPDVDDAADAR